MTEHFESGFGSWCWLVRRLSSAFEFRCITSMQGASRRIRSPGKLKCLRASALLVPAWPARAFSGFYPRVLWHIDFLVFFVWFVCLGVRVPPAPASCLYFSAVVSVLFSIFLVACLYVHVAPAGAPA